VPKAQGGFDARKEERVEIDDRKRIVPDNVKDSRMEKKRRTENNLACGEKGKREGKRRNINPPSDLHPPPTRINA